MEEIMEVMAAQLLPAVAVVLATLASAGMAYAIKWLKLKTGSEAVAAAGELVAATVNELTATTVKELKAASADGKLTANEGKMIKNQAATRVLAQLPSVVAKAAALSIGDLDLLISGKIEQVVAENKK